MIETLKDWGTVALGFAWTFPMLVFGVLYAAFKKPSDDDPTWR